MNFIYVLIALVVLGGGYYFYSSNNEVGDVMQEENTDVSAEEQAETDDDTTEISSDMPTVNDPDTVEMVVNEDTQVFAVGGSNFEFDVKEIRVKEGDTVTINFQSNDGFHDWVVEEFNAATDQVPVGTPTSVTFVADKAGTYEYYCSVGQHRANGMVGTLIVE